MAILYSWGALTMQKFNLLLITSLLFVGCGSSAPQENVNMIPDVGTRYALSYKGLRFYACVVPKIYSQNSV